MSLAAARARRRRVSTGSVSTRIGRGSAVSSCSGRVMCGRKCKQAHRAERVVDGHVRLERVLQLLQHRTPCLVGVGSLGRSSTGSRLTVARAAPVTMFSAPGPVDGRGRMAAAVLGA